MARQKTTLVTKEQAQKNRKWFVFDAEGKTLGRLSTEVAQVLRGKHKCDYTPHVDTGDGVIILNAEKIVVTGSKEAQKVYYRYTGHIGGLKQTPYRTMKERKPEYILEHAIKGMMPRNRLTRQQLKRLRIFVGNEHNMTAQKPINVAV
ncbi:MAG: 50S ribosomal protein L13 [Simkaniaceae bacterium]|nr:50S ribosomal protein L13 [Simkaniaceae bacterium]